jgi:hypothetical protein
MSTFTNIMQQRINALQNQVRYLQEHNYNLKKITRYLHESNMGGGDGGGSMGGGGNGSGDLRISDKPNFANETLGQNQGGGYGGYGGYGDQLPWWHTPNLGPIQYDFPPNTWKDGPPGSGIIRFMYTTDGRAIAEFNLNGQIVQRVYNWNPQLNMWFIVPNA